MYFAENFTNVKVWSQTPSPHSLFALGCVFEELILAWSSNNTMQKTHVGMGCGNSALETNIGSSSSLDLESKAYPNPNSGTTLPFQFSLNKWIVMKRIILLMCHQAKSHHLSWKRKKINPKHFSFVLSIHFHSHTHNVSQSSILR